MKRTTSRAPGFLENFRSQPLLFIASALGLLAAAVWKGGLGQRRGTRGRL